MFNGELGTITHIDKRDKIIHARFDGHEEVTEFKSKHISQLTHAYAVTGHKAQGSEFPEVAIMCVKSHKFMLTRQWFYTAFTRARHRLHLVGQTLAWEWAIYNDRRQERNTGLAERLLTQREAQAVAGAAE